MYIHMYTYICIYMNTYTASECPLRTFPKLTF